MRHLFLILFAAIIAQQPSSALAKPPSKTALGECPAATLGESPEDCPWAALTRSLKAQTEPLKPLLKEHVAPLARAIADDSLENELKATWAEAVNYDEYAKGIIVEPSTLSELAKLFAVSEPFLAGESRSVVHAGLQYTYAYLFSNLKTPFGYKRARWVRRDIESGFRLPEGTIAPQPKSGSLFRNVTTLALRLIDLPVPPSKHSAAKAITSINVKKFKRFVLRETIETEVSLGSDPKPSQAKGFVLSTYLIEFPKADPSQKNSHLLIYTLAPDNDSKNQKLVTVFPVESSFKDQIADPTKLGENQPIQLRYNGYHRALYQKPGFRGKRAFSQY